jgi:hypothetical protein
MEGLKRDSIWKMSYRGTSHGEGNTFNNSEKHLIDV